MTIKPIGNTVHIAPLKPTLQLPSGVVLPANYIDPRALNQYRVLSVGPGRLLKDGTRVPPEVAPGDYVLAQSHHDHAIFDDGTRIMDASDILMKWGGDDAS